MVEAYVAYIHARLRYEFEVGILLCQFYIFRIGKLANMNVSGFEFKKSYGIVRNDPENYPIEIGSAILIILVGF